SGPYVTHDLSTLPNARLASASTEITPSFAAAGAISWVLNAASVTFAKLANLTGLSVLGRAANTAGVMAAITATGARQALLSNAAGTAIGWRSIEGSDLPATSPYGWDDVLAEDPSSGANSPSVASGQHLAFAGGGLSAGGTRAAAARRVVGATGLAAVGPARHAAPAAGSG